MQNQRNIVSRLLFVLVVIILLPAPQSVLGQAPQSECERISKEKDFLELADRRSALNYEIPELEQRINRIQTILPKALPETELDKLRQQLKNLKDKPVRSATDETQIDSLEFQLEDVTSAEALRAELAEKTKELNEKKEVVRCVQQRISSFYSPEQNFKQWMSIIFAVLIGFVILGFFVLSNKDETMRRAIFSGQTGIQFLTLFSIVIAIILFGITGILQDKELAALLGGLSGYILGRYSNQSRGDNMTGDADAKPPQHE